MVECPIPVLDKRAIRRGDQGERWMGDDETHGVEISIAGGVGEMVRG